MWVLTEFQTSHDISPIIAIRRKTGGFMSGYSRTPELSLRVREFPNFASAIKTFIREYSDINDIILDGQLYDYNEIRYHLDPLIKEMEG